MGNNFKPNKNFAYYFYFISERMNIFWNKNDNRSTGVVYTNDDILQKYKFTNVYRVLDRSSQFLIKSVIADESYSKEDLIWRIMLYKHFNLPNTWITLEKELGQEITLKTDLSKINDVLNKQQDLNNAIYSNAYMVTAFPPFSKYFGLNLPKHSVYLKIFKEELIESGLISEIMNSQTFEELFLNIKKITNYGDFISYQIAQDLNYTSLFDFSDNEFCAAGPGTKRGIDRTFDKIGKVDYEGIIKWVHANFEQLMEDVRKECNLKLEFKPIPNHLPTVADLSNCFCETDKYLRGLGIETDDKKISGKRIKSTFKENNEKISFVFPIKWNLSNL